jgi:hypothetical protein
VLDKLLATEVEPGARELVMIVTTPGRVTSEARGRLVVRGSAAGPDRTITANVTDVAPTLLYALGIPISRAVAGAPLVGLFSDWFVKRYPVRYVPAYGRPSSGTIVRGGQPLDQEMMDRLRSLGYVR